MKFRLTLPADKITNHILSLVTDAVWLTNPNSGLENAFWDCNDPPIYVVECENCPKDFPKEGIHWQPCQS